MIVWIKRAWRALKKRIGIREDCRDEWRKFSTWITAIAIAVYGVLLASPELAVQAWHMLPDDLRTEFPHQDKVSIILFGMIFIAKFVKQKPRGE